MVVDGKPASGLSGATHVIKVTAGALAAAVTATLLRLVWQLCGDPNS